LRKSLVSLAPLALCACVGNAFADDSSITLYGILDEAVANVAHALNFDPDHPVANNPTVTHGVDSATGILNGGMSATRWGVRGQEDLGDGYKAVFLLEEGFNLGSGNVSNAAEGLATNSGTTGPNMSADSAISGQFFNRGAYVGLGSSTLGTITFGRQQSFFLDNIVIFDPILGSQAFSPMGFSGTYGGGGDTDDSRVDNAVKYKVTFGDVTVGALYKFGGVAGASSAQGAFEFNGVYASGPFAAQLGYQKFDDAFALSNASGTGTIKATAADTTAYMGAVKATLGQTTLRVGYEREEFTNPSNPTQDQAVTSIFGYALAAPASVTAYNTQKSLDVYFGGIQQDISPAWSVLTGYWHVAQNEYDCPTSAASGCSGSLNYGSLVFDYHFSKRTDTYFGAMFSLVSGGPANAVLNKTGPSENTNRIVAWGWRHMF
jgi:general bacterial porin, GBP family